MTNKFYKISIIIFSLWLTLLALIVFTTRVNAQANGNTGSTGSYSPFKLLNGVILPQGTAWTFKLPYLGGSGTKCVQVDNNGLFAAASAACGSGSGGGSGGGTFSTSTISGYPNVFINYSNNATDVVLIGSTSGTSTAKVYFDPNGQKYQIGNSNTASTTFMGVQFFPTVGQGWAYLGTNGQLNVTSTSSLANFLLPFTSYGASTTTIIGFTGGLFSTASSTFSNNVFLSSLSQGNLYVGSSGKLNTQATSTTSFTSPLSGTSFDVLGSGGGAITCPTCAVTGTTITINGTTNQITSSAGAQDLSANRTTTLSFPNLIINPQASTTLFSNFNKAYFGGTATTTIDTTGNIVIPSGSGLTNTGRSDGCATWASAVLTSTGVACGSGSGTSAFEIGTSSTIAVPQLAYFTQVSGRTTLSGVATSTLTASSPLTGSFTQVGTGGTLGCTSASSGVTGCLTGTDWNTFNGKQATISATWPVVLTGTTLSFGGLSTTTALSAGQAVYASGVNTLASIATSTATISTGLTYSGTMGSMFGGSSGNLTVNTTQNILKISGLTTNGFVRTSGSDGTLGVSADPCTVAMGCTNSTSFALNSIITSNSAGTALIATGTQLTVGNILATTTAVNTFGGVVVVPDGSLGNPSFSFSDDQNNGIYSPANDVFAISTNGLERFRIADGSGQSMFGTSTAPLSSTLTLSSSTAPQLTFSSGTAGVAQYFARTAGNNFYLGSTTVAGSATTTTPILNLIGSTSAVGISTSSPFGLFSIDTIFNNNGPAFVIGSSVNTLFTLSTSTNSQFSGGTTTPAFSAFGNYIWSSPATSATSTITWGSPGDTTSKTCFNAKTNTGTNVSFYFVGTTMVVEGNLCK